jgi:LysR family transcriptional regulator, glycine cleavage system transcriptional activator
MLSHAPYEEISCGDPTMARPLPPLNALRAFEAAARHLSFTKAADELHVTQTAISHQIRALEDWLGLRLFRRLHRGLLLTDEAQAALPEIRAAFDRLGLAVERLQAGGGTGTLTVSTIPSFAAKWLVPRLGRFRQAHPEIDIRLGASLRLVDFAREDVDLGIRLGRGGYAGLRADRLLAEAIFPVCSPRLLEGPHPLRTPDDLCHHTLLHDDDTHAWRLWLEIARAGGIDAERGPVFDDSSMLLQAAIDGQGVALGRRALAAADLAAGRLMRPFDVPLPYDLAYYIVCPEATAERPKVRAFRAWILAEAAAQV